MLLPLLVLFIVCLFIFALLAFLLPEWVGITGKKAKDVMRHQQGEIPNTEAPSPDSKDNRQ